MQHQKLAEIVVQFIEFLELSDNTTLDSHLAVKMLEGIAATLAEATLDQRVAVQQAAKDRLASLLRDPDEYGYSSRKSLTSSHRKLLESIETGEAFGWEVGLD